jgi:hypothetical protein
MPEFAKWVNAHAYDGGGLSAPQKELRNYYRALLALCQDPSVCGDGYWGLKYLNRASQFGDFPDDLYAFARFQGGAGRLLVVASNFRPNSSISGPLRIPRALATLAKLAADTTVRLVLDRSGAKSDLIGGFSRQGLMNAGFPVSVPNQSSHVYVVE